LCRVVLESYEDLHSTKKASTFCKPNDKKSNLNLKSIQQSSQKRQNLDQNYPNQISQLQTSSLNSIVDKNAIAQSISNNFGMHTQNKPKNSHLYFDDQAESDNADGHASDNKTQRTIHNNNDRPADYSTKNYATFRKTNGYSKEPEAIDFSTCSSESSLAKCNNYNKPNAMAAASQAQVEMAQSKKKKISNNKNIKTNSDQMNSMVSSKISSESAANVNTQQTSIKQKKKTNLVKKINPCYKKFSVGAYVHLLNENDNNEKEKQSKAEKDEQSEEQIIDNYYELVQKNKLAAANTNKSNAFQEKSNMNGKTTNKQTKTYKENKETTKTTTSASATATAENVDLEKIASSVNAHAKSKWKNNQKTTNSSNIYYIDYN
jgi:hypothetical protein